MFTISLKKASHDLPRTNAYRLFSKRVIANRSIDTKECKEVNQQSYIDKWQASTVKPISFYEDNAAPGKKHKQYFYSIDLQGRVYLEQTLPKNIATSLKNNSFLDFFFKRMRRVNSQEYEILSAFGAEKDYPFISKCGYEMNFVRPADSAIVFHTLRTVTLDDSENRRHDNTKELVFGGTLTQPFLPNKLAFSRKTGRLYHELVTYDDCLMEKNPCLDNHEEPELSVIKRKNRRNNKQPTALHNFPSDCKEFGLIKSSLAITLSDNIEIDSTCDDGDDYMYFTCDSSNEKYPIQWLPIEAEPGDWSLPSEESFID